MKTIMFTGLEWQIVDEKTGLICTKEIINSESIVGDYQNEDSELKKWIKNWCFSRINREMVKSEARLLTQKEVENIPRQDRIKKYKGELHWWWTGTPYESNPSNFHYSVGTNGSNFRTDDVCTKNGIVIALNIDLKTLRNKK